MFCFLLSLSLWRQNTFYFNYNFSFVLSPNKNETILFSFQKETLKLITMHWNIFKWHSALNLFASIKWFGINFNLSFACWLGCSFVFLHHYYSWAIGKCVIYSDTTKQVPRLSILSINKWKSHFFFLLTCW